MDIYVCLNHLLGSISVGRYNFSSLGVWSFVALESLECGAEHRSCGDVECRAGVRSCGVGNWSMEL